MLRSSYSLKLWKSRFLSRCALNLQILLPVLSCALLLVAVSGGVARADDGIVVINEEPQVAPVEVVENEQVQSDSLPSAGGGVDAEKKEAEESAGAAEPEQSKGDEAAKDVEEEREELSVEDSSADVGSPLGATRATLNLTAYGNVSPTNQYAVYSSGLLKEVPYKDGHYVFLQDSSQSYCMVVGKGDSLSSMSECRWWRWYNGGVNIGWVLERGTGSVSVSEGRYTVISDFEGYPAFQDNGIEVLRREVAFYALVAVVIHVLYRIWSYELRGAKRSLG